ncbi:MAG: choice-of-anchor B family protein [Acidimicrobiia bacterium]|nr:choice-of-anchor B family protein [Acidimicrobiia bacterium]
MSQTIPTIALGLALTVALAGARGSRVPFTDPPLGAHCNCAGGVCPLDAYGRRCSCGCSRAADAQSVQAVAAETDVPCAGGIAAGYPCGDVDLSALVPHADIGGGSGNDVWGWTDPVTGREYALVGRSTGTAFVDISTPTRPVYIGNLPTKTAESIWRGIKVYADHAFIVSEAANHGMQVFDLRRLRSVTTPPVTLAETAHYSGFGSTHTLAVNSQTGFAYATGTRTCEGGLHAVDVRTPAAPRTAGCFSLDGYSHETQCVIYEGPDALYRGREVCFSSNEDTLTIVDAGDKHEMVQLSRTGYGGSAYTHQGWLTGDHRFFLVNDEGDERAFRHPTRTWIWDVSDLDAPVIASHYDGPTPATDHNLFIRGDLVYEANYRSGLRVLDASDLAQGVLREVGFFDVYPADDAAEYNGAWSVYPFFASGSVAVNGIEQGLFVLNPRTRPRLQATGLTMSLSGPAAASPDEDWVYVARVANEGPGALADVRVMEQPPSGARLVAARASQGQCSTGAAVACELGSLAAGAEAFVTVTIRTDGERDFISTAIAAARGSDGASREVSARAVTRGLRDAPALTLHRPGAGTTFRTGRNNTVQWTLRGVTGGVSVELSRDDGGTWATLAEDAENVGFYDWTGTGAAATRARVRVTSLARPELTRTSAAFSIAVPPAR